MIRSADLLTQSGDLRSAALVSLAPRCRWATGPMSARQVLSVAGKYTNRESDQVKVYWRWLAAQSRAAL